ncbi:MAG: thermonuclease family protein [Planctomycetes bacterium]|nr:thermonuclease family protein [Planctomycetota bacterium]
MDIQTNHKIIRGDSRKMKELQDKSVHLVITSPPYWQLKDYGTDNQIGFNDNYEDYINNLNLVWKNCYRVLDNGCRLCINIGDQFARSVYYGRYKVVPIRTEIIKFCESVGFDYMGAIIWQKRTTTNTTGGASIMGSFPYPRNGIISIDYEFILLFKKIGTPNKPDEKLKKLSKISKEEWKEYFSGHWNFGGTRQNGHVAMFPEELPRRLIKMFAFVGDTILDPFLGSGTTSLAARNLGRNSVGYEINHDFIPIIEEKLQVNQPDLLRTEYKFTEQGKIDISFAEEIQKFPYIFKDFHTFDKKIDPKKLQFGSKICKDSVARQEYYSVKEIISPELVKLSNNLTVRLIGVRENKKVNGKALEFLKLKTQKQKVFMKYDEKKYDENNRLLCYLYLKNKTFLNAHLIKKGLARTDLSFSYKYKNKFSNMEHSGND